MVLPGTMHLLRADRVDINQDRPANAAEQVLERDVHRACC